MADYTNSKNGIGAVYPVNCIDGQYGQVEPMITPAQLKMRHLFGIPLVSNMVDPISGQRQIMTDPILQDCIERSVSMAEAECKIDIFPKKYRNKEPFDRNLYESFMFCTLERRPIYSIDLLAITPANNIDAYVIPPEWIETANIRRGQVTVLPITAVVQNAGFMSPNLGGSGGNNMIAMIMAQKQWLPCYWKFEYTAGFPEGQFPKLINELVGVIAAMEVLALLASTNALSTGSSISIDGLSQSDQGGGPQIYDTRIQFLTGKRDELIGKIRSAFGTKLFSGTL